uniref:Uncharacterized protein n=1 Tax=Rangifer tarandus platyrhynchus TaxID=3082113 RepID=A0ACB0DWN1_RANTA|nr:unnamed protein product [Rangifer tarandus platyrhynchus]
MGPRCAPPWPTQQLGFYFPSQEAGLGGDQKNLKMQEREKKDQDPLPPTQCLLLFSSFRPTPRSGKAPTPTGARGVPHRGRSCAHGRSRAAGSAAWGRREGRGAAVGLRPRRGGTMGPHPGEGGREAACARPTALALADAAAAGARLRLERAGRGAGGERGGGRRRRRRRRVWRAGGRAAGPGLVNKLRCCLGLAGPGAAAAAAARERRCRAPAAARPSASAPASGALARFPQPPTRAPRGPAAEPRGM